MSRRCRFLLASLLLMLSGIAAAAPMTVCDEPGPLYWVGAQYPPFLWGTAEVPQGFAYELIEQMGRRLDRKVELDFYPWARILGMVSQGRRCGSFPVARTPEREPNFRWLIPVLRSRYVFYGKPEAALDDLAALRTERVGVIRASASIAVLRQHGFTHLIESNNYADLLRMIDNGTITAAFAFEQAVQGSIKTYHYKTGPLKTGLALGSSDFYFAASPALPDAEMQAWQRAWRELQANGTVERLRIKYGISKDAMLR